MEFELDVFQLSTCTFDRQLRITKQECVRVITFWALFHHGNQNGNQNVSPHLALLAVLFVALLFTCWSGRWPGVFSLWFDTWCPLVWTCIHHVIRYPSSVNHLDCIGSLLCRTVCTDVKNPVPQNVMLYKDGQWGQAVAYDPEKLLKH